MKMRSSWIRGALHHEKRWLGEAQDGIKISGRNINNLRYADDITLMTESEEELKSLQVGSVVKKKKKKNPPVIQETGVQSLGWEDPL